MFHTIHPIEYHEIQPDEKLVFLAGPIRGAKNWREQATMLLSDGTSEKLIFVSPDRLGGEKIDTPGHESFVNRQRQWELYYLRRAVEKSKEGK